jgi:hypothetical protein
MTAFFLARGQSERDYAYAPLDIVANRSEAIWQAGVNFLIARRHSSTLASGPASNLVPDQPAIVYVGAAPDLFRFLDNTRCWETAQWKYGADTLLVHSNLSDASREAERQDLVAAYTPPMNDDGWLTMIARAFE